ncbi:hypothetical protein [Deinococcus irradiatisoli]|uniref:hypothetical protein n=1 Tax=Deinococcus irradiatisoli TaxID=2202254 RepID=UPI0015E849ED|nr:hypothetical protein [Deinococcus irradiatisoli]
MTTEKPAKKQPIEIKARLVGLTPEVILKAQRALVRAQMGEWAAAEAKAGAK